MVVSHLSMNETDEDTGVFEGTVYFTSTDATSGSNLRVSEGDTVTAEYSDNTLPEPYTDSDDIDSSIHIDNRHCIPTT